MPKQTAEKNKVCRICGDKASSFHFAVISCESCKSFYRRHMQYRIDDFTCPYDDQCTIDKSSRNQCKRCRLAKCFKLGMRKVDRQDRNSPRYQRASASAGRKEKQELFAIYTECPKTQNWLDDLSKTSITQLWQAAKALRQTDDAISHFYEFGILPIDENKWQANFFNSKLILPIIERQYIRIVEWCKLVPEFTTLQYDIQLTLVKLNVPQLCDIYCIFGIDRDNSCLRTLHFNPELHVEIPFALMYKMGHPTIDAILEYMADFDPDWQTDFTLCLILMTIMLFEPRPSHLQRDWSRVKIIKEYYKNLLFSYVTSQQRTKARAKHQFFCLMRKCTELQQRSESAIACTIRKFNFANFALPLTKELLDFKTDEIKLN